MLGSFRSGLRLRHESGRVVAGRDDGSGLPELEDDGIGGLTELEFVGLLERCDPEEYPWEDVVVENEERC